MRTAACDRFFWFFKVIFGIFKLLKAALLVIAKLLSADEINGARSAACERVGLCMTFRPKSPW